MLANAQNAMAHAAAMICIGKWPGENSDWKSRWAHPDVAPAAIASTRAMIDFHGRALARTLATRADRSTCGPSGRCIGGTSVLPMRLLRPLTVPGKAGEDGTGRAGHEIPRGRTALSGLRRGC